MSVSLPSKSKTDRRAADIRVLLIDVEHARVPRASCPFIRSDRNGGDPKICFPGGATARPDPPDPGPIGPE